MIVRTSLLLAGCMLVVSAASSDSLDDVIETKRKLEDAYNVGDVQKIRAGTTANHIAITDRFQFFSQADQIKSLARYKITKYAMHDMKAIPLTEDSALVTYWTTQDATYDGMKLAPKVRVLEAWVRRDGEWLQMSYQTTPILTDD